MPTVLESDRMDAILGNICILFEKLIGKEEISQVASVLEKHGAISKSQRKKVDREVSEKHYSNAWEKVINSLKQKEMIKFEDALNDEEFPGDTETKQLLCGFTGTLSGTDELGFLVKNCKTVEKNLSDVENMLGVEKNEGQQLCDKDRVKHILFSALTKLQIGGREERDAVKAIKDFIAVKRAEDPDLKQKNQEKGDAASSNTGGSVKEGSKFTESCKNMASPQSDMVPGSSGAVVKSKAKESTTSGANKEGNTALGPRENIPLQQLANKGPTTRSQTKESNAPENSGHSTERLPEPKYFFAPLPEDLPCVDEQSRILEFRVVVVGSDPLPANVPLCIKTEILGWQPSPMQFHDQKKYYFSQFFCYKDCQISFKYKFCYLIYDVRTNTIEVMHERLPGENRNGIYINRKLELSNVKTSHVVITSVCMFDTNTSWKKRCCDGMGMFLPNLQNMNTASSNMLGTSPEMDIFSWISCVKHGWKTCSVGAWDSEIPTVHEPQDYQKVLIKWLEDLKSNIFGNKKDLRSLNEIALTVAMAFAFEKIIVHHSDLLELIFEMLKTDKLGSDDLLQLYKSVMDKHQGFSNAGLELPLFSEALQWLYKQIPQKAHIAPKVSNLVWLFSLPLYWVLKHGEVRKAIKHTKHKNLLLSKAALPPIPDFDWSDVQRRCKTAGADRLELLDLKNRILETSGRHPWIVSSFQFMLTSEEVYLMMVKQEENEIVMLFPVECALHQYLQHRRNRTHLLKEDLETCDKFISMQIIEQKMAVPGNDISTADRQRLLDVCAKLLEICNSYVGRCKLALNQDILWCINTVALSTVSWASLLAQDERSTRSVVQCMEKMIDIIITAIAERNINKRQVEYWGTLLSFDWDLRAVAVTWKELILVEVENAIQKHCLDQKGKVDYLKYLNFYVDELGDLKLQADVEKFFNEKASKCAEELLKSVEKEGGLKKLLTGLLGRFLGRSSSEKSTPGLINIFERLFLKEYQSCKRDRENDSTTGLKFLCGWSFAAQFYKIFGQVKFQNFSEEGKDIAKKVSTSFKTTVKLLLKKDITIEQLNIVLQNKDKFLSVCSILAPSKENTGSSVDAPQNPISDVLCLCESYLKTFKRTQSAVDDFVMICNYADYGVGAATPCKELDKKSKASIQKKKILDLAVVGPDQESSCCKYFEISQKDLEQFQQLSFLKDSDIFLEKFVNALQLAWEVEDDMSWPDVLVLWENVKAELFALVESIHNGSITMDAIADHFKTSQGAEDKIEAEVSLFYDFYETFSNQGNDAAFLVSPILRNRDERKKQICNFFHTRQANAAVDVLLTLREMLHLKGDFSIITKRKEMVEEQNKVRLREVPDTLTIPEIASVDDNKLKVLEKFIAAEKVIDWLKEKMKDMNEVKVMCDLAMISAGEDVVEVDRVSGLLSAVLGFAPLIFWTEEDKENAGSKELIERCEKVWENATPELLKKWDETSRQLHWFKEVEKFYGSVEKSSLSRAQEINASGTYKIARRDAKHLPTKEDCILLTVPKKAEAVENGKKKIKAVHTLIEEDYIEERVAKAAVQDAGFSDLAECRNWVRLNESEEDLIKKYSAKFDLDCDPMQYMNIEQLRELQSKLMLIAGEAEKGREDVNVFIDVLASVQKLSEAYVELVSSGCMLFAGWEVVINCHGGANVTQNLKVEVRFTTDSSPITGCGSYQELNGLTKILKKSLQEWNNHICSQRNEFYYLNEYNIQQVMYLCHELSHAEDLEEIPEQVYQLLTFVKKELTRTELQTCLLEAKDAMRIKLESSGEEVKDVQSEIESVSDDCSENQRNSSAAESDAASLEDVKEKFKAVHKLIKEDRIEERVAKAAVQDSGFSDLAECRSWVLLNEFDEDLIDKYSAEFDLDCDFTLDCEELEADHSVFSASLEITLNDVIAKLREDTEESRDFLQSISTVCSVYMDETVAMDLQDHLSVGLLGQFLDNLSEESEISRQLLPQLHQGRPNLLVCAEEEILPTVLSLYMHSEHQPLPSRSEVLVCSEESAIEEVERFMRRAMSECHNRGQLLYALAFADKLSYSTSSAVEDIFNELSKSKNINEKYQLVILLTKQQHYLATCLDKYLVDGKWNQSAAKIQSYLKCQLNVKEPGESAASATEGNYMVKVVTSARSGVGKSLYVQRLKERLADTDIEALNTTIRMLENKLNLDYIIERLQPVGGRNANEDALLVHVDLTPAVRYGIEALAFNLFILGSIQGSDGRIWKTHPNHLYAVEMTDFGSTGQKRYSDRHILNLLPSVTCYAPQEVLRRSQSDVTEEWLGMDPEEFQSETFQRPFQYLSRYEKNNDLDLFAYAQPLGTEEECIAVLLRHCCIDNPSWAQLRHFCSFLNVQLKNCEKSVFCTSPYIKRELVGLKAFAVKFMVRMAQDFATPSLEIADKSMKDSYFTPSGRQGFQQHQIRRRWEESAHPYVFFNDDGQTMTFINVKIDKEGYLLGQDGLRNERITTDQLVAALQRQGLKLDKDFDTYCRQDKLRFLRQVLGVEEDFDPDPTYELTTDNVLKILAIYMRFRCHIPVIIMGETGCGKTRLVEFMTKLKTGSKTRVRNATRTKAEKDKGTNMITLKIHGGVTVENIQRSIEEAKKTEIKYRGSQDFTVLFYDEANTTEAIYAIKEVMCDGSINGESFGDSKLRIIAACNPYKKLSDEAIKKLEDSGLGYRIRTSETAHLFGNIPVRSLVYRVVALPPSMQPFIWDFGQLSDDAEKIYIQQMTRKLAEKLELSQHAIALINDVLSRCQRYMRQRRDECRYVSLRDVERSVTAYEWFYERHDAINEVRNRIDETTDPNIDDEARALIQTVGVCYHASLDERKPFREELAASFHVTEASIKNEMELCQTVFLRNVRVGENIAINEALRENVFMMAVCSEMKIPLFLIGKPGSSKSLAKTIVTGNMQGQASHAAFYRSLKQIHILSYQCSALTDAEGIERVFNQCIQLQAKQNPDTYTAVVVLDEIGLAEDSANMPLKVLHPLLERRSTDLTTVHYSDAERVGFIGISNWALDPAKMNRGIFLTRNKPTKEDLIDTGKKLVQPPPLWQGNEDVFESLTTTYIEMYIKQQVEYFGLRDYYSLMKMICRLCCGHEETKGGVGFGVVNYSILRNFSGRDSSVIEKFVSNVCKLPQYEDYSDIPAIPVQEMIRDNLEESDSRFLLLLANQFSVVSLLETCIESFAKGVQVVFGSSFPDDHSYTEICRNINRIKVCMETGKTVILLNMANIHESLYDALNQHYVTFGGQNYVDLGLGGHRVKCRIASGFRLIVIEKKEVVFDEYPIPLINRLEKHLFNSESLLNEKQRSSSKALMEWARKFTSVRGCFTRRHAFIGFHDDTASSVVLTTTKGETDEHKKVLLQSCAMDALLRLPNSQLLESEVEFLQNIYFKEQQHDGLADVIRNKIEKDGHLSVLEITSFSGVLSKKDVSRLESDLDLPKRSILLLTLEQFQTQQEYCARLDQFFELCEREVDVPRILLVQCAQAQFCASLIACARHCLMNKVREAKKITLESESKMNITVALLLSTEREGADGAKTGSLALQHTQESQIIYVDELRPADDHIAPASNFFGRSLCDVFELGKRELEGERRGESLVNIRSLLIDCVCEAVARIKGQNGSNGRYLKRVEILMYLCKEDGIAGDNFRKILMKKVGEVYRKRESEVEPTSWIMKKANDRESLQEGGTFRKTLWLCLKEHLSQFIALVISIVDRCSNLDMIVKGEEVPWELNMWLEMFQLIEVNPQHLSLSEYTITGPRNGKDCKLPFSFLIIDFFESRWRALEEQHVQDVQESLMNLFHECEMKKPVSDALDFSKISVLKKFATDVIANMYKTGTQVENEVSVVEKYLFDMSMKNFASAREEDYFEKGDEIVVIFMTFKSISKKLEKFSEVLQSCPQVLKNLDSWVRDQDGRSDFILHIRAFKDVLNLLREMAEDLEEPTACIKWIDLARTVKQMYDSVTSKEVVGEDEYKVIQDSWRPFSLLDLLLLQLLPPAHLDDELFQRFVKIVAPHAKLFWRGSAKIDPRSYNFIRMVLNVLKRCFKDVELQLLIGWQDPTCKSCKKKVQNPVFLPCGHFTCEKCAERSLRCSETRRPSCPVCNSEIPENFSLDPSALDDESAKILAKTKSNCTSFFLEYLQQFCFERKQYYASRMEQQAKQILKQLIVQSTETDRTELDSTGLDLNVNSKSCILGILHACDQELVAAEINSWLQSPDVALKRSVVTVYLKYTEQKLLTSSSRFEEDKEKLKFFWKNRLGCAWTKLLEERNSQLDIKMLQRLAEVRCALGYFASLVKENLQKIEYDGDEKIKIDEFTQFCLTFLTSDAMPQTVKDFVIKSGCRKFGKQWLFQLAQHEVLRILIPFDLRQAAEEYDTDYWVPLGQVYMDTKAELYQSQPGQCLRVADAILGQARGGIVPHMLAIASWSDKKSQLVKDDVAAILNQHCGNRNSWMMKFLTQDQQKLKFILESNLATKQQVRVLYQLLILVIAAAESHNDVMKGFHGIITTPQTAHDLFLPAMPEDVYFATPAEYRIENNEKNSMYKCPKGHLYSIGDCTRPYVTAQCPTCKAVIGGARHVPAVGNERAVQRAQTQAGYKHSSATTGTMSTGAERMSPQGAAVVQFLLHSCLLAAAIENQAAVSSLLPLGDDDDPEQFLISQLQKNLQDLSKALARNEDDAILILQKLLLRIVNQGPRRHTENWSSLDARKIWEQVFRRDYLLPVFQNLDQEIADARTAMRRAEEAESVLSRLIDEVAEEEDLQEVTWEHPFLWNIVEHPTSTHLLQVLEDRADAGGEVLQIIIQTPDLHFVKHLENILSLQASLVEKYQYNIDMNEAETITFRSHIEESARQDEEKINHYIKAWNQIFPKLFAIAAGNLHSFFDKLSLDSPISMALPSTRGRGQCAKLLAEYLIDIQNQFLANCMMVIKPAQRIAEVEVPQVTDTDFVCIDKRRDLLKLIDMHTSYSIEADENGRRHHISYNVEALEKQVREKFVLSKKQIRKNTLIFIKYPQDVGIGSDWKKVYSNIRQEPLTAKLSQDIDRVVERSHSSEVCEGARTLTIAISFLAMIKADPAKSLVEFLEKDLKLPSARISLIPRSSQICHVLSVYQRLCWHKAVIFVQQGLDPYKEALVAIEADEIAGDLLVKTKEALRHTDVETLQQRMNEILITAAGIDNADWSLVEDVFPNVEFLCKNEDDDSWFAQLPEELCVKHISNLFAWTVNFEAANVAQK